MEVAGGQSLRARVGEWSRRARELGCESRGPVKVDDRGVWAFARRTGGVEIWHRQPTPAEALPAAGRMVHVAKVAVSERVRESPSSAAATRVAKLFGGKR